MPPPAPPPRLVGLLSALSSASPRAAAPPPSSCPPLCAPRSRLPVGQYIGSVAIASAGAGSIPIAVPVVLNVVAQAVLAGSATSLSFAYTIGLAAPAAQNLTVTSTGGSGNVPVTAQVQYAGPAVQSWLTVTP